MNCCDRSLVWVMAAALSGAVVWIDTSNVIVSGVPCTCPEPTTVTCRFGPLAGDDPRFCWSHAETPITVQTAAATTRLLRTNALAPGHMRRTLPAARA